MSKNKKLESSKKTVTPASLRKQVGFTRTHVRRSPTLTFKTSTTKK